MRKVFGYTMLVISVLVYGVIFTLPLFHISVGMATALATGLIITGEVAFGLGIVLLGKEVWEKIKTWVGWI